MSDKTKRTKSPVLALILSVIFPGLGQIYTRQVLKGIAIVLLYTVINLLLMEPLERLLESVESPPDRPTLIIVTGYTIASFVLWLYSIIDAKRMAERINREEV
ncbi:MAG TPA: hypothetical protein VHT73_02545 [Thermodesulfobacteriota bacterium]|nr:hypothetical protein [Thermodesulfobacteriota bacterium]